MKLVTKNGNKFATGMFWQIPDDGKRKINLSKLNKDTKYNMLCQINSINTWGFCYKHEMQGEKKVASLGKFIIEASNLSASYGNSIICFKFKNAGELDDDGKTLSDDLYGYIVLLNGTICPDEGEYVANFNLVRESIISQAKKYEIETLYLPLDVAGKFFSIFEILIDNVNNDELLINLMHNLTKYQQQEINNFLGNDATYLSLQNSIKSDTFNVENLDQLRILVESSHFGEKLKTNKEQDLKYLIPSIIILSITSDMVYWSNDKYKLNFNNALIQSISSQRNKKYRFGLLCILVVIFGYFIYKLFIYKEPPKPKLVTKPVVPHASAVLPLQLINNCLLKNDRFFGNLGSWTLMGVKCDSLGASLTFTTEINTSLGKFAELVGSNSDIKLNGKTGVYSIKSPIKAIPKTNNPASLAKIQIIDQLQKAANANSMKLSIPQSAKLDKAKTKFSLISTQSPVYLFKQGILDNVKLTTITATFDKTTGFYNWTLVGEF